MTAALAPPPARAVPDCRHCGRPRRLPRARGLCRRCYGCRAVRDRYDPEPPPPCVGCGMPVCPDPGRRRADGLCSACAQFREGRPEMVAHLAAVAALEPAAWPLAHLPTAYTPGTPGKVAVLAARHGRGLPFWLAGDAAADPEGEAA